MLYNITRSLAFLLCKLLFALEARGEENIPREGGFILASNHASYLDPIVLGAVCRRKLNFMAKEELFGIPLFSRLILAVGAFPLKRNAVDLSALKEAMRRLENGGALVVFPEGRREFAYNSFAFLEPQDGIGFLVAKLNMPVIPAFIQGSARALPRNAKFIRRAKICVYFGKPRSFSVNEAPHTKKTGNEQNHIERRMPYHDIAKKIMEDIRLLSCQALN